MLHLPNDDSWHDTCLLNESVHFCGTVSQEGKGGGCHQEGMPSMPSGHPQIIAIWIGTNDLWVSYSRYNRAENAIRPFVIGRKNYLFSQSVRGVRANANLYLLIETAKAHGIDPHAYLRRVFEELPMITTLEGFEALLLDQFHNRD